jgi:hypothetical protein
MPAPGFGGVARVLAVSPGVWLYCNIFNLAQVCVRSIAFAVVLTQGETWIFSVCAIRGGGGLRELPSPWLLR